MSESSRNGIIFLASIFSKMSQMFSDINSMYLQAMLDNQTKDVTSQFSASNILQKKPNEQHHKKEQKLDDTNVKESQVKPQQTRKEYDQPEKKKNKIKSQQLKEVQSHEKSKKDTQIMVQPPHPPPSSYLFFFNEHRQKIAQNFPNLNITELNKIGSRCWKELTDQQKKPYHDRFNREKEKYYEALKVYNQSKGQTQSNTSKKGRRKSKIQNKVGKVQPKPSAVKAPEQRKKQTSHEVDGEELDQNSESSLLI